MLQFTGCFVDKSLLVSVVEWKFVGGLTDEAVLVIIGIVIWAFWEATVGGMAIVPETYNLQRPENQNAEFAKGRCIT